MTQRMITPSLNLYSSPLARDAAVEKMSGAVFVEQHQTFSEFVSKLDSVLPLESEPGKAARAGLAREISGGAGRVALLAQAARDANPGELERVAGSERALAESGKLIAGWKGLHLRPGDVRAAGEKLGATGAGATLRRLAKLFELYEKRLGTEWTDREARERALLRRLQACLRLPARLIAPGGRVELIGYHRLAYFQSRVIANLIRMKHAVTVRPLVEHAPPSLVTTFAGAEILRGRPAASAVSRIEAPTPYAEVYEIGRRVREWIVSEKIRPAEIAVSFRDLGPYSQAVHDVFTRLDIPFFERRGEPAVFQPLVRVALSAIDACIEGLNRRGVFRFLCAGPVDVAALAGESKSVDPAALNALALGAGVENFFGADAENPAAAWRARFQIFSENLAANSWRHARLVKRGSLIPTLLTVIDRMESLRGPRSAAAFALAWKSFFKWKAVPAFEQKESLALDALSKALEEVAESPNARTETIELADFAGLLNAALQQRSIQFEGTNRSGVRVLNFYDLRGLNFKRVIIGGMAEGVCPARGGGDALLGSGYDGEIRGALSKQLSDNDARAFLRPQSAREMEEEERALFSVATSCADERVLLTRPLTAFNGSALGASEYWDEFKGEIELGTSIQPAPPLADCLTLEERELRAAWILGGGTPEKNSPEVAEALNEFNGAGRLKSLAKSAALEQCRLQNYSAEVLKKDPGAVAPKMENCGGSDAAVVERTVKRLAPRGIGDPLLSPSDIENLAKCSFKFFVEKICKLEHEEEPGEELSMLEAGSLWHQIFSRFYAGELERARALGQVSVKLIPQNRAHYLTRLQFFTGEELAFASQRAFTGHPGFWKHKEQHYIQVLERWLDCELQNAAGGFHPALIEFAFGPEAGNGGGRELVVPLAIKDERGDPRMLRIRGRLDRLDVKLEEIGGVTTVVAARIIDYKMGRAKSYCDKVKPESLAALLDAQLPIYLAAAIQHLDVFCSEHGIGIDVQRVWKESCAGYYSIRDTPVNSRAETSPLIQIKAWPLGDMRTFLDPQAGAGSLGLFDLIRESVTAALQGNFPVEPEACAGVQCPARVACRHVSLPEMKEE